MKMRLIVSDVVALPDIAGPPRARIKMRAMTPADMVSADTIADPSAVDQAALDPVMPDATFWMVAVGPAAGLQIGDAFLLTLKKL